LLLLFLTQHVAILTITLCCLLLRQPLYPWQAKSLTSSRPSSAGHKHLLVNKYAACKRRSPQAPATIAHIRAVVNLAGDNLPGPSAAEDAAETADLEQLQQSTPVVTAEPAGPSRAGSLASSQNEDVVVVEVLIGGCQATVDGKAGASKAAAGTKRRSKLLKIFKGAAAAVLATVGVCLLFKRCPGASRSRL
jgi:hypothetical protein